MDRSPRIAEFGYRRNPAPIKPPARAIDCSSQVSRPPRAVALNVTHITCAAVSSGYLALLANERASVSAETHRAGIGKMTPKSRSAGYLNFFLPNFSPKATYKKKASATAGLSH